MKARSRNEVKVACLNDGTKADRERPGRSDSGGTHHSPPSGGQGGESSLPGVTDPCGERSAAGLPRLGTGMYPPLIRGQDLAGRWMQGVAAAMGWLG